MSEFSEYCTTCGIDVKKETVIKRFGKYFCSDDCSEKYLQKRDKGESKSKRGSC